jgi:hypothetical protein
LQAGDAGKVAGVVSDEWKVVGKCNAGNLQIQVGQTGAMLFKSSFAFAKLMSSRFIKRMNVFPAKLRQDGGGASVLSCGDDITWQVTIQVVPFNPLHEGSKAPKRGSFFFLRAFVASYLRGF